MNYEALVARVGRLPVFDGNALALHARDKPALRLQLTRWTKQGRLIRLKRHLYTLPPERRKAEFSLPWLANTLYSPSYLSLEYVLNLYDLIPERVHILTSVSALKTASFENGLGRFSYHHIKRGLFFGFHAVPDEHHISVMMAWPEKALLDFIYLHPRWEASPDFLEQNVRLQNVSSLKQNRLKEYAAKFGSQKIARTLLLLLREARK